MTSPLVRAAILYNDSLFSRLTDKKDRAKDRVKDKEKAQVKASAQAKAKAHEKAHEKAQANAQASLVDMSGDDGGRGKMARTKCSGDRGERERERR